ncbi:hypothetical protein EJ04DRAFT_514442 [Polyplosphaeria fusca]|uniref:Ribosomal protein S21 n=1 Tax=Polyplosphaeria fusca TaxID=682080 RepID=A0A9P4QU81_9PLEO|nr:hypothetical protein EJ04DRAFT_514442 [Polyplosphaeria fusca]
MASLLLRPTPIARLLTSPAVQLTSASWTRTLVTTTPSRSAQPQPKEDANSNMDISEHIDDIFGAQGRRPRPSLAGRPQQPWQGTSADLFESNRERKFGDGIGPRRSAGFADTRRTPLRVDQMAMPKGAQADDSFLPMPMEPEPEEKVVYPRLNPSFGRTIDLDNAKGRDIVRGLNMLGSMMARNKVKADFHRQRFHERPGLKRKRLKSERWRARFKKGFQDVTARVSELTRKGW